MNEIKYFLESYLILKKITVVDIDLIGQAACG